MNTFVSIVTFIIDISITGYRTIVILVDKIFLKDDFYNVCAFCFMT